MQRVVDCKTLPEKLRVPGDFDVDAGGRQATGTAREFSSRANGHGGLPHDHRGPRQPGNKLIDNRLNMTQISPVLTLLLRCSHTEEVHIGEVDSGVVIGGEAQSSRC